MRNLVIFLALLAGPVGAQSRSRSIALPEFAAAKFSLRADFARHTRHFRTEGLELVHHDVDGVLQLQNLAFRLDRDLFR